MSTGITRRRWKARKLREEGLTYREIAKRMRCSVSTVDSYLAAPRPEISPVPGLQDADGNPVAGAEAGNQRAVKSGVHSERRIAPVRDQYAPAGGALPVG